MRASVANVGYNDLYNVCVHFFGEPRQKSSSHAVFKTPWEGKPWVNIQEKNGKGKPYQIRQVLDAIEKVEAKKEERTNGDQ